MEKKKIKSLSVNDLYRIIKLALYQGTLYKILYTHADLFEKKALFELPFQKFLCSQVLRKRVNP